MFSVEGFLTILNTYYDFAILISIIVSIVIAILGVIPSIFVTGANIIFFGPIWGFLISLFGEVFGGWITFKLYRRGFKKRLSSLSKKHKLLEEIEKSKGNRAAFLILQGRIIPFIPSGFVTLAASVSEIDNIRFIIATLIGKIPSIFLEVLISYGVVSQSSELIKLILTITGVYLIYITIKKKKL